MMKTKILKLARRLNKFTIEDIKPLLQFDTAEIESILNELIAENVLLKNNGLYFYHKAEVKKSELPLMFQFHSKETIEMIGKCFCANIEVDKVIKILEPQRNCINKFYKYFREQIYQSQHNELKRYFQKQPRNARLREYFEKTCYLYIYEHKLFVSDKILKAKDMKEFNNDERLEIKNIYLRANRKVLNHSYKQLYHLHLAEEIWRLDKSFDKLYEKITLFIS